MNALWAALGILPLSLAPWIQRQFLFEWGEACKPLWRLPSRGNIALTFDDGPESDNTPQLLDMLDAYEITATFFVVGYKAEAHPDLVRRIVARGHAVGSHGMTHTPLAFRSRSTYLKEVREAVIRLEEILGQSVFLFRPPYGIRSPGLYRILKTEGLRPVFWDVMAYDWFRPSSSWISSKVVKSVRDGSVVLLHDGGGKRNNTIHAIPCIAEGIRDRDFDFIGLDDAKDYVIRQIG